MKSIKDMSHGELAAYVQTELRKKSVDVVLSGGAAVSIYTSSEYMSYDIDLVITHFADRKFIREVMEGMDFKEVGRHFEHPETSLIVEFPAGPLSIGDEQVGRIDEIRYETGILRVISPTDSVKDRLAAYYHWGDQQSLLQATAISAEQDVDLEEIKRWSIGEGKFDEFEKVAAMLGGDLTK
jgi:hypothetical protein